jgi:putative ATP-dependent endonuclease of OLD family
MIQKIMIQNYRTFKTFELNFQTGMNIIVGDNDAGKSTLLEAIDLALTNKVNGRPFAFELSPYLFNADGTDEYIAALVSGEHPAPPEMIIDLFLTETVANAALKGSKGLPRVWLSPDL